jgi:hypothetical protein
LFFFILFFLIGEFYYVKHKLKPTHRGGDAHNNKITTKLSSTLKAASLAAVFSLSFSSLSYAACTADINMGGNEITNLGDATADNSAATYAVARLAMTPTASSLWAVTTATDSSEECPAGYRMASLSELSMIVRRTGAFPTNTAAGERYRAIDCGYGSLPDVTGFITNGECKNGNWSAKILCVKP